MYSTFEKHFTDYWSGILYVDFSSFYLGVIIESLSKSDAYVLKIFMAIS